MKQKLLVVDYWNIFEGGNIRKCCAYGCVSKIWRLSCI